MTKTAVSTEPVAPEVKVGDFFYSSWGYDQTNIDYYKVVSRTAKSVKIQQWSSKSVESDDFHDKVVPGEGPKMYNDWSAVEPGDDYWERQAKVVQRPEPPMTKRLKSYSDRATLSMNSYSNAYHWDGSAKSQTGPYGGH